MAILSHSQYKVDKLVIKLWLDDNDIKMHSTHKKGKSLGAERSIRTLKHKIHKHMTAVSKNVYFDMLDDNVDKYNNTYHRTIRMKPTDVKSGSYAEYSLILIPKMRNLKYMIM